MICKKKITFIGILFFLLFSLLVVSGCVDNEKQEEQPEQPPIYVLNEPVLTVYVDESFSLEVLGLDDQTKANWKSSNVSVAEVAEDGTVTGLYPGKATIRVTYDETELSCQVTVAIRYNAVPVLMVDVPKIDGDYTLLLPVGDGYAISPMLTIEGEPIEVYFTYTGATESIKVENGRIVSTATGTATIIVSCEYDGKTYSECIKVTAEEVE